MAVEQNHDNFYRIEFEEKDSATIGKCKKFKTVTASTGQNRCDYCLCSECAIYLDEDSHPKVANEYGWCSFVWYLLSNEDVHEMYGSSIWRFIPQLWRPWWLRVLKTKFPNIFNDITLDSPVPVFVDKSLDIKEWNNDIESYFIARLASASNKFLRPVIKCPWGCSEFQHKVGHIPFDIIMQRILQRVYLKKITEDAAKVYNKVSVSLR